MKPLTHTMPVMIGNDEVQVELSFTYLPGTPETGPSYSSGGEPATGAEVEIISAVALIETGMVWMRDAKQDRHPVPAWIINLLQADDDVIGALIEEAQEQDQDAADYAAEMRADMRREEAA